MWTPDYFVRLVELPRTVNGVTLPNDDGTFDIYLNSLLTEDEQKTALEHEIEHIIQDHFYNDVKPLRQIEAEADKKPAEPPKEKQKRIVCFTSLDALKRAWERHLQRKF